MKTDSQRRDGAYSPALIGFVTIAALLLVSSIWQQITTARYATLMLLAKKIELAEPISADAIPTYVSQVTDIVSDGNCRSDIVRAGLTVVLADLDRQNSNDDYEAWAAAMAGADVYLRHALSCSPADGNLWLRLAMVRFFIAAEPRELAYMMNQSVNLAPVEPNIVAARFTMWNRLDAPTLQQAARAVESDLRLLMSKGPLSMQKAALADPSEALRPYVEREKSSATTPIRPSL